MSGAVRIVKVNGIILIDTELILYLSEFDLLLQII
jgi:hypothetical protein